MTPFAELFIKYRLRSEIKTLKSFADMMAGEGYVYEASLFTRWQKGNRIPKDRKVLVAIIKIFLLRKGITSLSEINSLLESAGQGYVTKNEKSRLIRYI
ncbi:MAG: hypothetical protein O3B87_03990 [bacterium]|nr:hypothetical protein [bacterium]